MIEFDLPMTACNLSRFTLVCALLLLSGATLVEAQQKNATSLASWSGVIINSNCSVDEAFAESAKCTEKGVPGGKLSLYDDTLRLMLNLDPQDQAAGLLGDSVTVEGALDGDTIHATSIKMLAGIGLAVGQKAPAFSAHDQFGTQQTLDTLKGPKGTVLLFFRSADW
jgi:hypothetical protein